MPDYNKQYDFIKYWMFTSPLGPNAAPSTFDACFEAVTAEFGPDALIGEQVRVFHSDSLFSKILTFSFLGYVKANMNNQRSTVWKITMKLLSTETELKNYTIDSECTEGRGPSSEFHFTVDLASDMSRRNQIHELASEAISDYAFAHADVSKSYSYKFS